jgi:FkbM family methyltransferase
MKSLLQIKKFIDSHPLASKHKLSCYYKFLYWQFSQFLKPHERVVSFLANTKLVVKKGMTGATGNIYTGLHDFNDMGFLLHFLNEHDLFFDIGANVGSYTVLASGVKNASSISFEPIPSTFESLNKNILINCLENKVKLLNIAVGAAKGSLSITNSFDTINHVIITEESKNNTNVITVDVLDFDSLVVEHGFPILVKIDVEGFETEVLNGMKESLKSKNIKAIIIELNGSGNRYGFDEVAIHKKLIYNNFLPYIYDPFLRKFKLLESFGNFNTIYIKDIDFVTKRVLQADKIKIFSTFF